MQNKNVAEEETYLILGASGRQGSAVVDALLSKNCLPAGTVYGASRNPESLKKRRGKMFRWYASHTR